MNFKCFHNLVHNKFFNCTFFPLVVLQLYFWHIHLNVKVVINLELFFFKSTVIFIRLVKVYTVKYVNHWLRLFQLYAIRFFLRLFIQFWLQFLIIYQFDTVKDVLNLILLGDLWLNIACISFNFFCFKNF